MSTVNGEKDFEIVSIWKELCEGKQWKETAGANKMSRQWFDIRRKELFLPSPAEIRRQRKLLTNPPKKTLAEIMKERTENGWLTLTEAARCIGITTGVLAFQTRKQIIESEKEGGCIFISKEAVKDYLDLHRRNSPSDNFTNAMLTVSQCAKLSGKSEATVYADIQKGTLIGMHIGSSVLISEQDYERWNKNKQSYVSRGIPEREIRETYRALVNGVRWEDTELSKTLTYKGFDKRRTGLHLPTVTEARKIQRGK